MPRRFLAYLRQPMVLFSVLMAEFSVGFYLLLRLLQGPWISLVIGPVQGPTQPTWGFTGASLGLSLSNFTVAFPQKVEYWLLLYGLLLLLPLLKPRALLLALPWLFYTFFSSIPNYVTIGYQYGLVAAFPVFVGMAYAMDRVSLISLREVASRLLEGFGRKASSFSDPPVRLPGTRRPREDGSSWGTVALVGIVVGGALLSPITPWNIASHIPETGPPGFWGRYNVPEAYAKVVQLVGLIPSGASVLASTDLFPYVANNVNAYSTLWYQGDPPYLPFNVSHPPRFVLVSQVMWANLPSWVSPLLSSPSYYGLYGYVGMSPLGWIKLYQGEYQGNVTSF